MQERPREITIFKSEIRGTTFMELRLRPSTALKAAILGLGVAAVILGGREAVNWIDDTFTPQYVVNGSSAPSYNEEPQPWQPRTDWKRK